MILKCGRQNGRQKWGCLSKKRIFDRINLSNMQKNEAFMLPYSHNYPILVRSTGIEVCDDMQKALVSKAFFAIERHAWTPNF